MNVDTVKQRPTDLPDVALNLRRGAAAVTRRVAKVAARTGVHGCHQHERRREGQAQIGAHDRDLTVFERLAKKLQYIARALRELVEKQHAVVRQTHFAGPSHAHAAANESGIRYTVVRRTEGTISNQAHIRLKNARNAVHLGCL